MVEGTHWVIEKKKGKGRGGRTGGVGSGPGRRRSSQWGDYGINRLRVRLHTGVTRGRPAAAAATQAVM